MGFKCPYCEEELLIDITGRGVFFFGIGDINIETRYVCVFCKESYTIKELSEQFNRNDD